MRRLFLPHFYILLLSFVLSAAFRNTPSESRERATRSFTRRLANQTSQRERRDRADTNAATTQVQPVLHRHPNQRNVNNQRTKQRANNGGRKGSERERSWGNTMARTLSSRQRLRGGRRYTTSRCSGPFLVGPALSATVKSVSPNFKQQRRHPKEAKFAPRLNKHDVRRRLGRLLWPSRSSLHPPRLSLVSIRLSVFPFALSPRVRTLIMH